MLITFWRVSLSPVAGYLKETNKNKLFPFTLAGYSNGTFQLQFISQNAKMLLYVSRISPERDCNSTFTENVPAVITWSSTANVVVLGSV